jgi:hypothetical protein
MAARKEGGETRDKICLSARGWWLTPVILATQEDCGSKPAQVSYLKKPFTKIGLIK